MTLDSEEELDATERGAIDMIARWSETARCHLVRRSRDNIGTSLIEAKLDSSNKYKRLPSVDLEKRLAT